MAANWLITQLAGIGGPYNPPPQPRSVASKLFGQYPFWEKTGTMDRQIAMWGNRTKGVFNRGRWQPARGISKSRRRPYAKLQRVAHPAVGLALKFYDTDAFGSGFNATGGVQVLNNVSPGTDVNNRVGDRISMKSIEFRMYIAYLSNVGTLGGEDGRFMIVYDRQPVPGTTPAITTILQNTTGTTAAYGFPNPDNKGRFVILHDSFFSSADSQKATSAIVPFQAQGVSDGGGFKPHIHKYIKLRNAQTIFERGSTNIHTGALYAVTLGSAAAGSEQFEAYITTRVTYTDT